MNKFNRRFNRAFERISFWEALSRNLNSFKNLLQARDCLTSEDRKILYVLHSILYECYEKAKTQRQYHEERLEELIERRSQK